MPAKTYANIVIGLGETGQPLYEILKDYYPDTIGIDLKKGCLPPKDPILACFLHICIPGGSDTFLDIVQAYITQFDPDVTCIHSSVPVGTTRALISMTGASIVHTPIIGKHSHMKRDMLRHPKFISYLNKEDALCAFSVFETAGMQPQCLIGGPEVTELGKLLSTTLYTTLISFYQEAELCSRQYGVALEQVQRVWNTIDSNDYDTDNKFAGVVGGHCCESNVKLLLQHTRPNSPLLKALLEENEEFKEVTGLEERTRNTE